MEVDDSFRRPGSVPFKWEIEPGIPKELQLPKPKQLRPPPFSHHRFSPLPLPLDPTAPPKLRRSSLLPTRSELRLLRRPSAKTLDPPPTPVGCLPVPFLLLKSRKVEKQRQLLIAESDSESSESVCASDLETLARWSNSNRKSLAPFLDSPSPSSSSSSPKSPVDAEWAAFGLF